MGKEPTLLASAGARAGAYYLGANSRRMENISFKANREMGYRIDGYHDCVVSVVADSSEVALNG